MFAQMLLSFVTNQTSLSALNNYQFIIIHRKRLVYEWKYLEYDWDSDEDKQAAIDAGEYIKEKSLPTDVEIFNKEIEDENGENKITKKVFVSILRDAGVPASFATVTDKMGEGGPLLRPYPDWSATKGCDGLTGVIRTYSTECNYLWILDSGVVGDEQKCPPKIVIYNLETDEKEDEILIPEQLKSEYLSTIVVQSLTTKCNGDKTNSAAYMADSHGNMLLIWNGTGTCQLKGEEFAPNQNAQSFTVGNDTIEKKTGILGLAIYPPTDNTQEAIDEQYLLFRPLASYEMFSVSTKDLRDYCTSGKKPQIKSERYKLPSHSVAQVVDNNDVLFFNSVEGTSVNCWDTYKVFNERNNEILSKDPEKLQWVSGMKMSPPGDEVGSLVLLSNRYQKFYAGTLDINDVNYRIFTFNTYAATFSTECAS